MCIDNSQAIPLVCYGQGMDLRNAWVVLCIVAINTLYNKLQTCCPSSYNPWVVRSVPCTKYGLSRRGFICFLVTVYLRLCRAGKLFVSTCSTLSTFKNKCEFSLVTEQVAVQLCSQLYSYISGRYITILSYYIACIQPMQLYILTLKLLHNTCNCTLISYRIRQNIHWGKLSQFSRIFVKHECFTIENFPS